MSDNTHYEYAVSAVEAANADADGVMFNDSVRADALIYATLALTHEQRTANMVSLLVASETAVRLAGVDYSELADTIKERLGL